MSLATEERIFIEVDQVLPQEGQVVDLVMDYFDGDEQTRRAIYEGGKFVSWPERVSFIARPLRWKLKLDTRNVGRHPIPPSSQRSLF